MMGCSFFWTSLLEHWYNVFSHESFALCWLLIFHMRALLWGLAWARTPRCPKWIDWTVDRTELEMLPYKMESRCQIHQHVFFTCKFSIMLAGTNIMWYITVLKILPYNACLICKTNHLFPWWGLHKFPQQFPAGSLHQWGTAGNLGFPSWCFHLPRGDYPIWLLHIFFRWVGKNPPF